MRIRPAALFLLPDCFKAREMYIRAVETDPWQLNDVPDNFEFQVKMMKWE